MLLRRVTKHVKDQNWFAVGVDFFIVVVGVFIGIQVANWNEDQQVKVQQKSVERRLAKDFELIRQDLSSAIEGHEAVILSNHTLRQAIERGTSLPEEVDDIKNALTRGFSYQQAFHRSGTFIEIISSGKLDLIEDERLRVRLIRYDVRAQESLFNLNQIRNYMNTSMPEFNRYLNRGPLERNQDNRIVLSRVLNYDIAGMAADQSFVDSLDLMIEMQTWVQLNLNGQEEELAEVLTLLQGDGQ